jgi:PAS domain S-box-containing protein
VHPIPILSFFHFFCAIAYGYLIAFILIKNPKALLNRIFAAIFACFFIWSAGKIITHFPGLSRETALGTLNFIILGSWGFSAFVLWFVLVFTEKTTLLKTRWIYWLIFGIPLSLIFYQWQTDGILDYVKREFGWGLSWKESYAGFLLKGYILSVLLISIALLYDFKNRSTSPLKRKQARLMTVSSLCGFALGILTNMFNLTYHSRFLPDSAHAFGLVWGVGIVVVMVKYKFLTITPATAAMKIVSTMADALILTSPEGVIENVNKSACEMLEYRSVELEGQPFEKILRDKDRSMNPLGMLIECETVRNRDFHLKSKTGKEIPVSLSSSLLTGPENTLYGLVIIARDITEKMDIEKALRKEKIKADQANQAKSDFLANMSHELRTPLNHIIGFSELLHDQHFGELNATQVDYLKDVLESSRHLLSLINDILDISKIEAGKLEAQPSYIRLATVVENSLNMIREKAMKNNIRLHVDLDQAPETLYADHRKLKQILYNLLSNAVKFTPPGGKISICAETQVINAHGKPGVEIHVADTGMGLKTLDLERIFNPFEQVESSLQRKYQGTGLGLSLTRRLVELHGGSLFATSDGEGKGSCFSFVLPQ